MPVIAGLLQEVGLPAEAADRVTIVGDERPFATPFAVVEAAASVLGAIGAAASLLWRSAEAPPRRSRSAGVTPERRWSASRSRASRSGDTPVAPWSLDRPLVKLYQCRDERWIHLHGEFAHLGRHHVQRARLCRRQPDRGGGRPGGALGRAGRSRTRWPPPARAAPWRALLKEWSTHPQARAIAPLGRVSIEKIGDSLPEPLRSVYRRSSAVL